MSERNELADRSGASRGEAPLAPDDGLRAAFAAALPMLRRVFMATAHFPSGFMSLPAVTRYHGLAATEDEFKAVDDLVWSVESDRWAGGAPPSPQTPSLDAAWKAAEAALPEGWLDLRLMKRAKSDIGPYFAAVHNGSEGAMTIRSGVAVGHGSTPAAALLNLADRLSGAAR